MFGSQQVDTSQRKESIVGVAEVILVDL